MSSSCVSRHGVRIAAARSSKRRLSSLHSSINRSCLVATQFEFLHQRYDFLELRALTSSRRRMTSASYDLNFEKWEMKDEKECLSTRFNCDYVTRDGFFHDF